MFDYTIELREYMLMLENGDIDIDDVPDEARDAIEEYREEERRAEYADAYAAYVRGW